MLTHSDPGKKSLVRLLGDNGKEYNYSNRRRLKETRRLKYNTLINNKKSKTILKGKNKTISKLEMELTEYSGKTTYEKKFLDYVKHKIDLRKDIIEEENYNKYLKKLNWHTYINKQRHEDTILNEIEKVYGKNASIIIGDWGNKGRLSYISTPGIGLKRLLRRRFNVYHLDEYKTSQINCITHEENKNLRLNYNNKNRKMHSIFTYQMLNGRQGCINRDRNAIYNMKSIVESLIKTLERPEDFRRDQTSSNPPKQKNITKNKKEKDVSKKESKKTKLKNVGCQMGVARGRKRENKNANENENEKENEIIIIKKVKTSTYKSCKKVRIL